MMSKEQVKDDRMDSYDKLHVVGQGAFGYDKDSIFSYICMTILHDAN